MKYRQGFVTNSSSSSYVVTLPHNMRLYELLGVFGQLPLKTLDMWNDGCDFKEVITDPNWYQNQYGCCCNKTKRCEACRKLITALEAGHKVLHINLSYYGNKDISAEFGKFRKAHPELVVVDFS